LVADFGRYSEQTINSDTRAQAELVDAAVDFSMKSAYRAVIARLDRAIR
jgi:hypothetical protein